MVSQSAFLTLISPLCTLGVARYPGGVRENSQFSDPVNGSPTGTKRGAWLLLLLLLLMVMMMISRNLEEPSCVNNQFCSLVFFY